MNRRPNFVVGQFETDTDPLPRIWAQTQSWCIPTGDFSANREGIAFMSRGITLAPCGLIIERVESGAVGLLSWRVPSEARRHARHTAALRRAFTADISVLCRICRARGRRSGSRFQPGGSGAGNGLPAKDICRTPGHGGPTSVRSPDRTPRRSRGLTVTILMVRCSSSSETIFWFNSPSIERRQRVRAEP